MATNLVTFSRVAFVAPWRVLTRSTASREAYMLPITLVSNIRLRSATDITCTRLSGSPHQCIDQATHAAELGIDGANMASHVLCEHTGTELILSSASSEKTQGTGMARIGHIQGTACR